MKQRIIVESFPMQNLWKWMTDVLHNIQRNDEKLWIFEQRKYGAYSEMSSGSGKKLCADDYADEWCREGFKHWSPQIGGCDSESVVDLMYFHSLKAEQLLFIDRKVFRLQKNPSKKHLQTMWLFMFVKKFPSLISRLIVCPLGRRWNLPKLGESLTLTNCESLRLTKMIHQNSRNRPVFWWLRMWISDTCRWNP
jgi:hypothetical protein